MSTLGMDNWQLPFRTQSLLGSEYIHLYNQDKSFSHLALGQVTKVNYQYNTVDFTTLSDSASFTSQGSSDGSGSAQIPVDFGGKLSDGRVFGHYRMITVGTLVVVGFLDSQKSQPIVIGVYVANDVSNLLARTAFTSADDSDETVQKDLWQDFFLYPSMTYFNIDGHGNIERTFSGHTFLYVTDADQEEAYVTDNGFEYDMLPSSRYSNGELIEPVSPDAPSILFKHGSIDSNHNLVFYISPKSLMRLSAQDAGLEQLSSFELDEDGNFRLRRQFDSSDPNDAASHYLEMALLAEGSFEVTTTGGKVLLKLDGDKPIIAGGGSDDVLGELQGTINNMPTEITKQANDYTDQKTQSAIDSANSYTNVHVTDLNQAITDANQAISDAQDEINSVKNDVVYKVDLTSTNGILFRNNNIQTTIFATVYRGATNITSSIPDSGFHWKLVDENGNLNETWTNNHNGVGYQIEITDVDIVRKGTISCDIDIPDS